MYRIFGDPKLESILTQLVFKYGVYDWDTIAEAFYSLYKFEMKGKDQLKRIWTKLIRRDGQLLSDEEQMDLVKLGMEQRGNLFKVGRLMFMKYGTPRNHNHIRNMFRNRMRQVMIRLTKMLCRQKLKQSEYVAELPTRTFKRFLGLGEWESNDPIVLSIQQSISLLTQLILSFYEHYKETRSQQYEVYSKITTRWQFEQIITHYRLIDELCTQLASTKQKVPIQDKYKPLKSILMNRCNEE